LPAFPIPPLPLDLGWVRLWTALCLLPPRKEYLEGETLADRLAKGPLHEVDQLPAARFLCQSRSRRQQVMPEPQPNSFANIHTKPRSPFSFSSAINRGGTKPAGCDDPGFGMAPHLARTRGGRLTSELAGALTRSCGYTVPRPGTWVLFSHVDRRSEKRPPPHLQDVPAASMAT
jgi:hypothetical protein